MKSGLMDLTHLFGKLQVRRAGGREGRGWGPWGSVLRRGVRPEAVGQRGRRTDSVWQGGSYEAEAL